MDTWVELGYAGHPFDSENLEPLRREICDLGDNRGHLGNNLHDLICVSLVYGIDEVDDHIDYLLSHLGTAVYVVAIQQLPN